MESADYQPVCDSKYDNFFNLTATYKLNSDIPFTYMATKNKEGQVVGPKRDMTWVEPMAEVDEVLREKLSKKTKAVAWFGSLNCTTRSKRQKYVQKLQEVLMNYNLTVDIYSNKEGLECEPFICPLEKPNECDEMLERDYHFYLSFEKSFTEDLASRDLMKPLLTLTVPIVLGDANYSSFMPPGSYIEAPRELRNMKKLARTIADLIGTPKYYDFFRWKNYYSYSLPNKHCSLCTALNNEDVMGTHKVYQDIRGWWYPNYEDRCRKIKEKMIEEMKKDGTI
ncbi:alpha-(1,3)-fucosyltransferase C-like [Cydia amplana]|uniref:alpha-(1,3)-fucosyltransferase C-like n=1 Tax=Cydia amplana TaxID=1869771 RepID=UPI002FE590D6